MFLHQSYQLTLTEVTRSTGHVVRNFELKTENKLEVSAFSLYRPIRCVNTYIMRHNVQVEGSGHFLSYQHEEREERHEHSTHA